MTYIVNEKCVNCRFTDCVEVCPVDCFYIGENTIVIQLMNVLIAECVNQNVLQMPL